MFFNVQKSKCMVIFPSFRRCLKQLLDKCDLKMDGKAIEFVSSYSHLGHLLTDDLYDSEDIMKRQRDYIGQVNTVLCFFRQQASAVKYHLFCSYCTSLYGCELWQLSHNKLAHFSTTWRKSVRKVWQLSTRVHYHLLPLLCRCLPIQDEICKRSLKFIRKCINSNVDVVRSVANYAVT